MRRTQERHLNSVHTRAITFACDTCGLVFLDESHLRRHASMHDGTRKFDHVCDDCGASFGQKSDLKRHRVRCPAPALFALQTHGANVCVQAVHTRARHVCTRCQRGFFDLSTLRRHTAAVHERGAEACPVCGREFKRQYLLARHMATEHPDAQQLQQPREQHHGPVVREWQGAAGDGQQAGQLPALEAVPLLGV